MSFRCLAFAISIANVLASTVPAAADPPSSIGNCNAVSPSGPGAVLSGSQRLMATGPDVWVQVLPFSESDARRDDCHMDPAHFAIFSPITQCLGPHMLEVASDWHKLDLTSNGALSPPSALAPVELIFGVIEDTDGRTWVTGGGNFHEIETANLRNPRLHNLCTRGAWIVPCHLEGDAKQLFKLKLGFDSLVADQCIGRLAVYGDVKVACDREKITHCEPNYLHFNNHMIPPLDTPPSPDSDPYPAVCNGAPPPTVPGCGPSQPPVPCSTKCGVRAAAAWAAFSHCVDAAAANEATAASNFQSCRIAFADAASSWSSSGCGERFANVGGSSIIDNFTGLVWEKKCRGMGCPPLQDLNPPINRNRYTFTNPSTPSSNDRTGTVFTEFLEGVNNQNGTGLDGHRTWRIPTLAELMSLIEPSPAEIPTLARAYSKLIDLDETFAPDAIATTPCNPGIVSPCTPFYSFVTSTGSPSAHGNECELAVWYIHFGATIEFGTRTAGRNVRAVRN